MKKIISFLVMALLLMACGNSNEEKLRLSRQEKARIDSIDRESFKVAVMPTLDCLPIYVAYSEKLFDTLDVTVHLKCYNAQMDCDTALIGGSVEGSISDLLRVKRLRKEGVKLEKEFSTNTYWQLFTNRLARIRELSQLSDKMIAITRYSATDYLTTLAIDSVHPKYDVYRIQINDVKVRLSMLLNNELDAALLTEPQATTARLHHHPVLMDSRDKGLQLGMFVFRSEALSGAKRQKQYQLFVKAYNMACDSINKNGMKRYSGLIKKYCGCDDKTIELLPKMQYIHVGKPRPQKIKE